MRKIRLFQFAFALLFISTSAIAQPGSKQEINIKSARFAAPLVEKWADEYEKINPGINISVSTQSTDEGADLQFVGSENNADTKQTGQAVTYTGRYALLPITNVSNPLLSELSKKRLNSKRLQDFFFLDEQIDATADSSEEHEVTVYSGNNADSFAGLFASHFGYSPADIKGRKISGDDIFLINAVQKDQTSATFNSLNYIFDLETRKLKSDVALLPLDIKRGQHEVLQEADADKTIELLENESIPLIPVEHIGFVYQNENAAAKEFLHWVLSEGQKFNHAFGFLQTEAEILSAQLKEISEPHYTEKF